jgi:acetylornithine deacetylase/succinyl-diaminopimelate desuccinylase-like protein
MGPDERRHDQVKRLLADLIRIDTTNPPGNERAACERLADELSAAGIPTVMHAVAPGRANLTARLRGTGEAPPLLLSAHLDVVPADGSGWTHAPFSGDEADGCLWGRGAVDMKHMAALSATAACMLAESKAALRRDVILAFVADEETGCALGSRWLVDHAPEEVRAGVALGGGGGVSTRLAGRRIYPVQVAEKGQAVLRLTARGPAGHGSMPTPDTAPVRLARAVAALGTKPLPPHVTPAAAAFVAGVLSAVAPALRPAAPLLSGGGGAALLRRLTASLPVARAVHAMLADTAAPTMLAAGDAANVIPAEATATVDGRTLPGRTSADLVAEVRAVIGPDVGIDVLRESSPVTAPLDHPFLDLLRRVMRDHDPAGHVVPVLTPGFTDAKSWSRLGTACYGFTPLRLPDDFPTPFADLFHGVDERVPVSALHFGLDVLWDLVHRWAGKESGG